jgi:hypothetical protein
VRAWSTTGSSSGDQPGGFEFVVTGNTLVLRDSQHEYVFAPEYSSTPSTADAWR